MSVLQDLADAQQERELEKVNAFYLQKEAEVSNSAPKRLVWLYCRADHFPSLPLAQDPPEDAPG